MIKPEIEISPARITKSTFMDCFQPAQAGFVVFVDEISISNPV
jgi:hypothetical protein